MRSVEDVKDEDSFVMFKDIVVSMLGLGGFHSFILFLSYEPTFYISLLPSIHNARLHNLVKKEP